MVLHFKQIKLIEILSIFILPFSVLSTPCNVRVGINAIVTVAGIASLCWSGIL